MKKRIIFFLILAIIIVAGTAIPVFAGNPPTGDTKYHPPIGSKWALPNGDVTTYMGTNAKGNEIWQAQLGNPTYIPGTNNVYVCSWISDGNGKYHAGTNDFTATVNNKKTTITYQGQTYTWMPDLEVGGVNVAAKNVSPTLLILDPINPNYIYNTLEWDYGNGVKRFLRLIEGECIEYYTIDHNLGSQINIVSNSQKSAGFHWNHAAVAWDNNGNQLALQVNGGNVGMSAYSQSKWLMGKTEQDVKYPITIDPDTSFTDLSADGDMEMRETTWSAVRADTSSTYVYTTNSYMMVQTGYDGAYYYIDRAALYFDTSAIPSGVTITNAVLNVNILSANTYYNPILYIVNGQPTYPHNPLTSTDYNYANYGSFQSNYGYSNTISGTGQITVNANNSAVLAGIINKGGTTKLLLIDSRDYNNNEPPSGSSNYNTYDIYSYEGGAGYRPTLTITYTATAPAISSTAATSISTTSAQLNSSVTDDGYDTCQVSWGYGTTSETAANFASYDTVTSFSGSYSTGDTPYYSATGLNPNTTYYYRVQIKNSNSTVTSTSEQSFTTNVATPTVTLGSASNVTSASARLNATITSNGGENVQVSWGYGLTSHTAANFASYDTVTSFSGSYATNDTPYLDISSLTPDSTYYFRIQVKNSAGTVTSSTEGTLSTGGVSISSTAATGVTSTAAQLNSSVTADGGLTCQVRWGYGTSSDGGTFTNYTTITSWSGSYSTSDTPYLSLTGLTPGTTYYFSVQIENTNDTSTSGELSFTTSITAPGITTVAASNVGISGAQLNSQVTSDGGEASQVRWGYDTVSHSANFSAYPNITSWSTTTYTSGQTPSDTLTGLTTDTTYYFNVQIKNSNSTVTGSELSFTTTTSLNEPSVFRALPSTTSVSLSIVKGYGATTTLIRYSTTGYPTSTTDGTLVYDGADNVYNQTGLTAGTTYYYSAWGGSSGNYTASYATAVTTTYAYSSTTTGDNLPEPTMFGGWFQSPDYTRMSHLDPLYSSINGVADSLGMPRNTAWFGLYLLFSAIISGVIMKFGGFAGGWVVLCGLMIIGTGIGLLPGWYLFISGLIGVFYMMFNSRGFGVQ